MKQFLFEKIQQNEFFGNILHPLTVMVLPLMKKIIIALAESLFIPLRISI